MNKNDFNNIDYFTGTENYYKSPLIWFNYTDGVKYVADHGCAWLVQDMSLFTARHQSDFICVDVVFKNNKATITYKDDDKPFKVVNVPFTDSDDGELKFFIMDNVCLLANEY